MYNYFGRKVYSPARGKKEMRKLRKLYNNFIKRELQIKKRWYIRCRASEAMDLHRKHDGQP